MPFGSSPCWPKCSTNPASARNSRIPPMRFVPLGSRPPTPDSIKSVRRVAGFPRQMSPSRLGLQEQDGAGGGADTPFDSAVGNPDLGAGWDDAHGIPDDGILRICLDAGRTGLPG